VISGFLPFLEVKNVAAKPLHLLVVRLALLALYFFIQNLFFSAYSINSDKMRECFLRLRSNFAIFDEMCFLVDFWNDAVMTSCSLGDCMVIGETGLFCPNLFLFPIIEFIIDCSFCNLDLFDHLLYPFF
jgi:hypothetical protein